MNNEDVYPRNGYRKTCTSCEGSGKIVLYKHWQYGDAVADMASNTWWAYPGHMKEDGEYEYLGEVKCEACNGRGWYGYDGPISYRPYGKH